MAGRHDGLTGLEQSSLERAGYFIRRAALPLDAITSARQAADELGILALAGFEPPDELVEQFSSLALRTEIQSIAEDLLPFAYQTTTCCLPDVERPLEWRRDCPLEVDATETE